MVGDKKRVRARLVPTGFEDPDLREALVDTSGCVSLRSSHLRALSLSAVRKWELWSLDIKHAFLQEDGCTRGVFLQAPSGWEPLRSDRVWKLEAPAYDLNGAPVVVHRSLTKHFLSSDASLKRVGLRRQVTPLGPCLFAIFSGGGEFGGCFYHPH